MVDTLLCLRLFKKATNRFRQTFDRGLLNAQGATFKGEPSDSCINGIKVFLDFISRHLDKLRYYFTDLRHPI